MNYDYYRVFLVVARCRSLTRAAEELYTSQPALTRTIKTLEAQLGTKLFSRSKKGVTLTPEGETLYEHVEAAFTLLKKGEKEVSASTSLEKGSISIGTTITALDEFLFDFVETFRASHPGIRLKINTQSSDKTIAALRQGSVDVAFVTTPYREFADVKGVVLKEFDNIAICGSKFAELHEGVHTLKELSQYPFVYLSTAMQLREYTDAVFASEHAKIQPLIELDSAAMIPPMVEKNLGISIVPRSLAQKYLDQGTVYEIKLAKKLPTRDVVMAESTAFPSSMANRAFIKEAKNCVEK